MGSEMMDIVIAYLLEKSMTTDELYESIAPGMSKKTFKEILEAAWTVENRGDRWYIPHETGFAMMVFE
jgi:hypothetical protein